MKNTYVNSLLKRLETFFRAHVDATKPCLIAYSGGIDSQALLHLALELKQTLPLDLHVIHVDHSWRETSAAEASELEQLVKAAGVCWHLVTLDRQDQPESDLENYFREKRYSAFKRIYDAIGAGCLMVAHQQDDLAETVFKRIFEGACLTKLGGLKSSSYLENMCILRPLLNVSKKELENYLSVHDLEYVDDVTNRDTKYLRARQREMIFPLIETTFGKLATKNLTRLAESSHALKRYLDHQIEKYEDLKIQGPFGIAYDFSQQKMLQPVELEHLINNLAIEYGLHVSYTMKKDIIDKLVEGDSNKRFFAGSFEIFVDRFWLFIHPRLSIQNFPEHIYWDGAQTIFESQDFVWKVVAESHLPTRSWKDLYKGVTYLELSPGEYALINANQDKQAIQKEYSENRVPCFLRHLGPLFIKNAQEICNPWIKTSKTLKERKGVKLLCEAKKNDLRDFS